MHSHKTAKKVLANAEVLSESLTGESSASKFIHVVVPHRILRLEETRTHKDKQRNINTVVLRVCQRNRANRMCICM